MWSNLMMSLMFLVDDVAPVQGSKCQGLSHIYYWKQTATYDREEKTVKSNKIQSRDNNKKWMTTKKWHTHSLFQNNSNSFFPGNCLLQKYFLALQMPHSPQGSSQLHTPIVITCIYLHLGPYIPNYLISPGSYTSICQAHPIFRQIFINRKILASKYIYIYSTISSKHQTYLNAEGLQYKSMQTEQH